LGEVSLMTPADIERFLLSARPSADIPFSAAVAQ